VTLREVELVPTVPADACTQITNSDHIYGSIALIERGSVVDFEAMYSVLIFLLLVVWYNFSLQCI